jgi:octaprenyl-diphosphate synthase
VNIEKALQEEGIAGKAPAIQDGLERVEVRLHEEWARSAPSLRSPLQYTFGTKGKFIRPLFLFMSAEATGSITAEHIEAACVIEMLHTASLVHDDIIDDAKIRRGKATHQVAYGPAVSVLLGDYLLARGFEIVASFEDAYVLKMFAGAAEETCRGEITQELELRSTIPGESRYLEAISRKTGSFFRLACEAGGYFSGASAGDLTALRRFGRETGTAYQIMDDYLDIAGCEEKSGQTLLTDLEKEKWTFPLIRLHGACTRSEKARLSDILLSARPGERIDEIRELILKYGIERQTAAMIRGCLDSARMALEGFSSDPLPLVRLGEAILGDSLHC